MNNTFLILALSIFIFLVIVLVIAMLILNSKKINDDPQNIKSTEKQLSSSTPLIYNDYVQDPNYNTINVDYQIVGTLSSTTNDPETIILPLYGKQIKSYRWKYYTVVNSLKIDIYKDNESCIKECEMLSKDDIVKIPTYNDTTFKVYLYDYQPPF